MDCRLRIRFPKRAVIAGVVACLFVLQGLFLGLSPKSANVQNGAEAGVVASTDAGLCNAHGGDGTPGSGSHDHSQCCVFCVANGRDTLVLAIAILFSVGYSAPEAIAAVLYFVPDDPDDRLIGWLSSWSSRAPPLFS